MVKTEFRRSQRTNRRTRRRSPVQKEKRTKVARFRAQLAEVRLDRLARRHSADPDPLRASRRGSLARRRSRARDGVPPPGWPSRVAPSNSNDRVKSLSPRALSPRAIPPSLPPSPAGTRGRRFEERWQTVPRQMCRGKSPRIPAANRCVARSTRVTHPRPQN